MTITKTTTLYLIGGTVLAWAAYDVIAYAVGGASVTISTNVWTLAIEYPITNFAVGVLIGHLYASMPGTPVVVPPGNVSAPEPEMPSAMAVVSRAVISTGVVVVAILVDRLIGHH